MSKRQIRLDNQKVEVVVGDQTLVVSAVAGNQINVENPPGGVRVRGVALEAHESFIRKDGDWTDYHSTTNFRLTVRPVGTYKDGTDAQRRSVISLFRQAAVAFAEANPRLLAEAEVRARSNALYHVEQEVETARKALNVALDKLEKGLEGEREAVEALESLGEDAPAPRM
jgi:hypothetical protein